MFYLKKILGIVKYQGVIEAGILPAKIKKEPFYPTSWDEEFRVATQIAVIQTYPNTSNDPVLNMKNDNSLSSVR